ncbi:hypothetical protein OMW55_08290 [Sphingomonas sp. BN140010]|uniref:Uncharacterized protein n=1 Tax=Sphingomonas arvum TaxID=2992113 RepID=A0ABT3JGB8_9SPHN|nr:hypothetical protein [Sphingomonas sp. BN140010]MCW3797800.1 hypothetical protein [Sphingomonas sp. BN140010]
MNVNRQVGGASHPSFVAIPDPARTAGVRAYREPAEPHRLQLTFLEEAGERAFIEELRTLLAAGDADTAAERLTTELAGFEGALAKLCLATTAETVAIDGWDDLLPILAEWEGPPITAMTLGLTNAPDLVFEAGATHEPELLLGLYSDEAYPFSSAAADELLAECSRELPAWVGQEEDVEFYCQSAGLAELNTALIQCKHRHFLRDGRDGVEGRAPGGYVEYVLGCWLRSTRFLQAVQRAAASGLPDGCRVVGGAVGVNADFVTLIEPARRGKRKRATAKSAAEPQFAALTMKPWIPREDPTADPASGASLRQRLAPPEAPVPVAASAPEPEPATATATAPTIDAPRPGWLTRIRNWLRLR